MGGRKTKPGTCPVCEEPWDLEQDHHDAEVWRFVAHNRTFVNSKDRLERALSCPGAGKTYEEGFHINAELDFTDKPFPADNKSGEQLVRFGVLVAAGVYLWLCLRPPPVRLRDRERDDQVLEIRNERMRNLIPVSIDDPQKYAARSQRASEALQAACPT